MSGNPSMFWDRSAQKWFVVHPHNGYYWKFFQDRTSEPLRDPSTNLPVPAGAAIPRSLLEQSQQSSPSNATGSPSQFGPSYHQNPGIGDPAYLAEGRVDRGSIALASPPMIPVHHGASSSSSTPANPAPFFRDRAGKTISGQPNSGRSEALDPNYFVRSSDFQTFFVPGKVFQVLWHEPAGSTANTNVTQFSWKYRGERIYSKIRRFVVIKSAQAHCLAIPIHTYNGRGLSKPSLTKSEHGIIYTGDQAPEPNVHDWPTSIDEAPMQADAIRVLPVDPRDRLDKLSRINYGKVYTVEYNVKVKEYGRVDPDDLHALLKQFFNVFSS